MNKFPDKPPPYLEPVLERGWQKYITDHPKYRERQVSADRLKEDYEVFVAAFIFGYLAGFIEPTSIGNKPP